MTLAQFRLRYPEFKSIGDPQLEAFLSDTALRLDRAVYGQKYDIAHGLLTAHLLAISPYGKSARLATEKGHTTYIGEFKRITREVAPNALVV